MGEAHGSPSGIDSNPADLLEARKQSRSERAAEMMAAFGPVDAGTARNIAETNGLGKNHSKSSPRVLAGIGQAIRAGRGAGGQEFAIEKRPLQVHREFSGEVFITGAGEAQFEAWFFDPGTGASAASDSSAEATESLARR